MVQSLGSSNLFGTINRVGNTENGRVIYSVQDSKGQTAGKISVAQKDTAVFEKSYKDMMATAPNMQKFADKHSAPGAAEKLKKAATWCVGIGAGVGLIATSLLTRNFSKKWLQALTCVGGSIAGFALGSFVAVKTTTPPGAMKFTKAMQNISKIDIRPVEE